MPGKLTARRCELTTLCTRIPAGEMGVEKALLSQLQCDVFLLQCDISLLQCDISLRKAVRRTNPGV